MKLFTFLSCLLFLICCFLNISAISDFPKLDDTELDIIKQACTCASASAASSSVIDRVVNGVLAERGQYKFAAAIFGYRRQGGNSHFCGAVFISRSYLLTARHCLLTAHEKYRKLEIRAGGIVVLSSDVTKIDTLPALDIDFARFPTAHSERSFANPHDRISHDLALIKLKNPVPENKWGSDITFACLPKLVGPVSVQFPPTLTLVGWGVSSLSSEGRPQISSFLRSVIMRSSPLPQASQKKMETFCPTMPSNRVFCTYQDDPDIAQNPQHGDSGGGVVNQMSNGYYRLYGIILTANGQGGKNGVLDPMVMANINVERYLYDLCHYIGLCMEDAVKGKDPYLNLDGQYPRL